MSNPVPAFVASLRVIAHHPPEPARNRGRYDEVPAIPARETETVKVTVTAATLDDLLTKLVAHIDVHRPLTTSQSIP